MIHRFSAFLLIVSIVTSLPGVSLASPGCPMARKGMGCPHCSSHRTPPGHMKNCCASHMTYIQAHDDGVSVLTPIFNRSLSYSVSLAYIFAVPNRLELS